MKLPFTAKKTGIFVTLLLLLAACGPKNETEVVSTAEASSQQSEQTSSSVQVETSTSIDGSNLSLDPAKTEDTNSLLVSNYLYDGLVKSDANGQVVPGLALSWVISDDELDYIFEIRQNAKFSDGSEITVDAIVENFNRWFEPESPLHGDGKYPSWLKLFLAFNGERDANDRAISQVDGIQKVDTNTMLIHLSRQEPKLLNYLTQPAFAVLSPSVLQSPSYGTRQNSIISSGPYVVTSWTEEEIKLSPNPQYWGEKATDNMNFILK
ncbi:MAG: ABC transporter substrate-binding protein [Anaerolineales bacterium]